MQPKSLKNIGLMYNDIPTFVYADAIILKPSISSAEGSLVRTSAMPESEWELTENEADYGRSSTESFANYDHNTCSWRTWQLCLGGEWAEFLGTWPASGTMRNGNAFQRVASVLHTHESACSLLPTPQAIDSKGTCAKLSQKRWTTYHLKHWVHGTMLAIHSRTLRSSWVHPEIVGYLMGFPLRWLSDQPYEDTETPLSLKSQNGSEDES